MKSPSISSLTARRFVRLATGLDARFADIGAALDHLGFVQIDPINVCGRMQDHILRHRVAGYREGVEMLDSAASAAETTTKPLLLAPLDPIIYDRRLAEGLWNFDYRWEVYVPPHKRVRGYYALPLLHGNRFIGHADVKADRPAGQLHVVSHESTSSAHVRTAVKALAGFLGLEAKP
jgi:uncharacterized protein YcaQ